jgi:hypothetical protein
MTPTPTCPKCGGEIDQTIVSPWGDGDQSAPMAPFICGWCASLFMLDLRTKQLFDPIQLGKALNFDILGQLRQNKPLWDSIQETRAKILVLPNRRPVKGDPKAN